MPSPFTVWQLVKSIKSIQIDSDSYIYLLETSFVKNISAWQVKLYKAQ